MMSLQTFPSAAAFYKVRGGERSGECDFGCQWQDDLATLPDSYVVAQGKTYLGSGRHDSCRVSVVEDTGDVYALRPDGVVILFGKVRGVRCTYHGDRRDCDNPDACVYSAADIVLAGWVDVRPHLLSWVAAALQP